MPVHECKGGAPKEGRNLQHHFVYEKITSFQLETSVENHVIIFTKEHAWYHRSVIGIGSRQNNTTIYHQRKSCQGQFRFFLLDRMSAQVHVTTSDIACFGRSNYNADLQIDISGLNVEASALTLKERLPV